MTRRTRSGIIVGVVLLAVGMLIRGLADAEGPQLLLSIAAFPIVGFIVGRAGAGLFWAFVLAFVAVLVNTAVFSSGDITGGGSSASRLAAIVLLSVIAALVAGVLGLIGGFIGGRVWRRGS